MYRLKGYRPVTAYSTFFFILLGSAFSWHTKCPLVGHFIISTDAVGHLGVVCLLYHEY